MNFLQLSQRLRQEAGLSGSGPITTIGQTGISKQVIDWINTAYIDVLSQHTNWLFMQDNFSFETIASQRKYSITETGVTDLGQWIVNNGSFRIYLTSAGVSTEQYLCPMLWNDYRQCYLFGSTRTAEGLPSYFSIRPDQSLDFYLVPDAIYTVVGEYFKAPTELVANLDEPIFPSQFHLMIVWRALMLYAAFDAANEKYIHGKNEYKKLLLRLEIDQLPQMTFGAPLV